MHEHISEQTSTKKRGFSRFVRRHVVSIIFIGGFFFDIFMLPEVDHFFTIILGTSYISLFALCLFLRELLIRDNKVDELEKETYKMLTFLISFCSGSSLSYIFTYSLRSADLSLSAPFLFIFFSILISNEVISSHRFRLLFDYVLLVISSSFYIIYMMPLITGKFNDMTFFLGIIVSAITIYLYTAIFSRYSPFGDMIHPKGNALSFSLPLIFLFLSFNYLLPPVPFKVEKIRINEGHVIIERDKNFLTKLITLRDEERIFLPFHAGENISYTTVYTLPDGVIARPAHVWYRISENGTMSEIMPLQKEEVTRFESKSLSTKIPSDIGNYKVITKVERRTVREDSIVVQ